TPLGYPLPCSAPAGAALKRKIPVATNDTRTDFAWRPFISQIPLIVSLIEMTGVLVVLVADVFGHFHSLLDGGDAVHDPGFGVGPGVFNRYVDREIAEVRPAKLFDQVHLFGMRITLSNDPGDVVEADGIDDQRVAFPVSAGIAVKRGLQVLRMSAAIHEELPVHVGVALEQHQDHLRRGEQRNVIRGVRGGPPGRHRASKSSANKTLARSDRTFSAHGNMGGAPPAEPGPAAVTPPASATICWP